MILLDWFCSFNAKEKLTFFNLLCFVLHNWKTLRKKTCSIRLKHVVFVSICFFKWTKKTLIIREKIEVNCSLERSRVEWVAKPKWILMRFSVFAGVYRDASSCDAKGQYDAGQFYIRHTNTHARAREGETKRNEHTVLVARKFACDDCMFWFPRTVSKAKHHFGIFDIHNTIQYTYNFWLEANFNCISLDVVCDEKTQKNCENSKQQNRRFESKTIWKIIWYTRYLSVLMAFSSLMKRIWRKKFAWCKMPKMREERSIYILKQVNNSICAICCCCRCRHNRSY